MEYCGRTILYVVDPNGVVILSDWNWILEALAGIYYALRVKEKEE